MSDRIVGLVVASAFGLLLGVMGVPAQGSTSAPSVVPAPATPRDEAATSVSRDRVRQDGRLLSRLRWVSPHGELPGTYAQYLREHPQQPARFSNRRLVAAAADRAHRTGRAASGISVLVHSDLYAAVAVELDQYVTDLTSEGHSVFVETVSGGTAEDIKAWVQGRYAAGSEGIVFVGDIPAAWAEVSGDVFPCDLFYMDVDGLWEDVDEDGDYEAHSAGDGDEGPEVFVARIYAYTLTYDTEANMVNGYLSKAHAYRDGTLTQPWRGLEYVDEDWYTMDVALDLVYGTDVVRHDFGYFTTGADYLNQMDLGQHFVQVCAHSYSGGHHFGRRPTESAAYAHVYVYSPSARAAKLLLGSDDGIRAWLNGDLVCSYDVYGGWQPDEFTVDVSLTEGWNRLLCKVSQGGGDYQFSARLTDTNLDTFADLEYQTNDPDLHGQEAPFIRRWLLNGFHQDISDNFWSYLTTNYLGVPEDGINPDPGDVMGGKTWTDYVASGTYVNLSEHGEDADFGVCYAFVRVNADSGTSCQLWLGYDDGARVWLNGQQVLNDNRYGGFEADMTKVDVSLNAGENRLLVKVSEWMGTHGFSARFAQADGSPVGGLTYDPEPVPVSYIATWLANGPYTNAEQATRLTEDYLGGEADVRPSVGDSAPFGTWELAIGDGAPFDFAAFYDHGDWVYSQTIQERDPPALFYNLFSCGPGRFTDADYLAGAYIFNTTYGLITVASAKSGSMLNFDDFTDPLGQRKTIGESYRDWFDAQAPFELWEREWYYGMVLCGDPILRPVKRGDADRDGDVDLDDYAEFHECISGPWQAPDFVTPSQECLGAFDFNADTDVDLEDFAALADAFTA